MNKYFKASSNDEHVGLEISDLMMTLVAVFLLGTVLMKNQADEYREVRSFNQHYLDELIQKEFSTKLSGSSIELLEEGILRFRGEFKPNSSEITAKVASELDTFCPALVKFVVVHPDLVSVIYFEGHTDESWEDPKNTAYYGNKAISEQRAVNTMRYCLGESFEKDYPQLIKKFMAVGYSYVRPVYGPNGKADDVASKRVDIKLVARGRGHANL